MGDDILHRLDRGDLQHMAVGERDRGDADLSGTGVDLGDEVRRVDRQRRVGRDQRGGRIGLAGAQLDDQRRVRQRQRDRRDVAE
jgi:hypothetical protein